MCVDNSDGVKGKVPFHTNTHIRVHTYVQSKRPISWNATSTRRTEGVFLSTGSPACPYPEGTREPCLSLGHRGGLPTDGFFPVLTAAASPGSLPSGSFRTSHFSTTSELSPCCWPSDLQEGQKAGRMGTQLHPSTANTNVASQRWGAGSQRGEGSQEISGSPVKLNMRVGVQGKEARAERGPGSPRLGANQPASRVGAAWKWPSPSRH